MFQVSILSVVCVCVLQIVYLFVAQVVTEE